MENNRCNQCGGKLVLHGKKQQYICENCGNQYPVNSDDPEYINYVNAVQTKAKGRKRFRRIVGASVLVIIVIVVLSNIVPALQRAYNDEQAHLAEVHATQVQVPNSAQAYIGQDAKTVAAELRNAGFGEIEFEQVKDVFIIDMDNKRGKIDRISINGKTSFSSKEWFPAESKVLISYHAKEGDSLYDPIINRKGQAQAPRSAKDFQGKNYEQVKTELESASFNNIELRPTEDLNPVTSIIFHENTVKDISINGNADFEEKEWFPTNAVIVLTYNSFARGDDKQF